MPFSSSESDGSKSDDYDVELYMVAEDPREYLEAQQGQHSPISAEIESQILQET